MKFNCHIHANIRSVIVAKAVPVPSSVYRRMHVYILSEADAGSVIHQTDASIDTMKNMQTSTEQRSKSFDRENCNHIRCLRTFWNNLGLSQSLLVYCCGITSRNVYSITSWRRFFLKLDGELKSVVFQRYFLWKCYTSHHFEGVCYTGNPYLFVEIHSENSLLAFSWHSRTFMCNVDQGCWYWSLILIKDMRWGMEGLIRTYRERRLPFRRTKSSAVKKECSQVL